MSWHAWYGGSTHPPNYNAITIENDFSRYEIESIFMITIGGVEGEVSDDEIARRCSVESSFDRIR